MYELEHHRERAKKLLSEILFSGVVKDPRVRGIFITRTVLSTDKSVLKVFYSITAIKNETYDAKQKKAAAGLNKAKGFIRRHLGKALGWRLTPELVFIYDDSLDKAERIDHILKDIHKNERP